MTKLGGWIAALLFAAQGVFFWYWISEFGRQAEYAASVRANCQAKQDEFERHGCEWGAAKDISSAQDYERYNWIGLGIGSALTLFGVWRGFRQS
jgi:hypothetical protein